MKLFDVAWKVWQIWYKYDNKYEKYDNKYDKNHQKITKNDQNHQESPVTPTNQPGEGKGELGKPLGTAQVLFKRTFAKEFSFF